jgi:hypothetical protein
VLNGGAGDDILDGSAGANTLIGSTGRRTSTVVPTLTDTALRQLAAISGSVCHSHAAEQD